MKKKILIVTPRSPFQGRGADELDRLSGIEWFIKNEYDVHVITKIMPSDMFAIEEARNKFGITIIPISYKFDKKNKIARGITSFVRDNAAHEYYDSEIQIAVATEIAVFKPDMVWFDYTYLWPLYSLIPKGIPLFTRSINFEPTHFLDENGRYPWNYIRVIPKLVSEWIVSRKSKIVFAITPKEQNEYQVFGAHSVVLPLRGLPAYQESSARSFIQAPVIHLGFTASTYSVDHNIGALRFILEKILPRLRKGDIRYMFHFTGSRLPESIRNLLTVDDVYEGFVPNMKDFWDHVDIALVPSLFGAGMQQKVFEPLMLGVPTITSKRAIAGYAFGENEVVCVESAPSFVREIQRLSHNSEVRKLLSQYSKKTSKRLFSSEAINDILTQSLV